MNTKEYKEIEMNIIYCLIINPELMNELYIEDKYFVNYKRLWKFMRAFYERYKTFDIVLMSSMCKDKEILTRYLEYILTNADGLNFNLYQKRLIELAGEISLDKIKINRIYDLANDLFIGNIDLNDFDKEYIKIKEHERDEK